MRHCTTVKAGVGNNYHQIIFQNLRRTCHYIDPSVLKRVLCTSCLVGKVILKFLGHEDSQWIKLTIRGEMKQLNNVENADYLRINCMHHLFLLFTESRHNVFLSAVSWDSHVLLRELISLSHRIKPNTLTSLNEHSFACLIHHPLVLPTISLISLPFSI